MQKYLTQLLADIEDAILARWQTIPPHFYQMGIPDLWLEPPLGWNGPPAGYALEENAKEKPFQPREDHNALANPLPPVERALSADELKTSFTANETPPDDDEELLAALEEAEQFACEEPVRNMFYHFGLESYRFPQPGQLSDEELDLLTNSLCRLWASFNFRPVFPDNAPGHLLYPLLLHRMREPTFVFSRGQMGVEFCDYEPEECPFGSFCSCKAKEWRLG
jgi:hypothetical protein